MRVKHVFRRNNPDEDGFHSLWRFAGRKADPIADAQNMCIHRHSRLAEGHVQHHIGRLAANPGSFTSSSRSPALLHRDRGSRLRTEE